jgi:hypothetical protein
MASSTRVVHCVLLATLVLALCSAQPQSPRPPAPAQSNFSLTVMGSTQRTPSLIAAASDDLLPDLVMLPLKAFKVRIEGNHKVLRFASNVFNQGDGPLDLTGSRPNVQTPELKVTENILQADGGQRAVKTRAVMKFASVDGHDHFHVMDFQRLRLRPAESSNWRGAHKEGFCLRDDHNLGDKPSRFDDAHFNCGAGKKDVALHVRQGLSEGWVDVYDWYLAGQFIDLEGLQLPGDFCVEGTVDPDRLLVEESRDNNVASTLVHISASDVSVVEQDC